MHHPPFILWLIVLLIGLCLGSFLNVVITRLPVMLMRGWRNEAREALELSAEHSPRFNLATPGSMCPRCEAPIAWHDNLPLIGWIKRRGRCAECQTPISVQYPLVEVAGGLLAMAVLALHGLTAESVFVYGACLMLLVLAVIDFRTQLLPDIITLPLLWAGLLFQLLFQPLMLPSAVIGAMVGYLSLWSFYWLFKLATGKEGMGYGDFKLLAALGAWLGWSFLPLILILSAGLGAIVGLVAQAYSPNLRGTPLPFGPFLALAGWVALLVGDEIMAMYLNLLM
ncbi:MULTISPECIES: prepilin peptidase [Halomonadaceae]|uniref:Prepilin leader peptidase/N-methyltransferase n=1 Tax=Vreelandella titanicae TaxID=664683 RepID=A0A1G8KUI0_9GAMM|nr:MULTISPECIES: A24 family peptidase [Halomonas]QKS23348.1 Type 4 prepilin-like proteins leader peptide-processing enzyme [Halomonas titanicae]QNU61573.1 prepilin peptidase [Halomonas titanicae]CDG55411.1 Type 4 prepilin-like proteins leader peptide-processing enzyme (Includes: Leader peptidase; N-methyltransferase) [Halomonas sp. A3H3]SDI47032.1 type 4 prepilin peptidase 1 . Aspartic peptidase. MEROPS family A24A [Halomonas titanicae]|tara:strand:+ start:1365 stop:2210 length:846 start_codon:yes stop_codon:yes gene_type:complete